MRQKRTLVPIVVGQDVSTRIGGLVVTLTDELLAGLGDSGLEQVAGMLGTDPGTARIVTQAVAGTIIGGMARDAEHPDGADALLSALDDHKDTDPFSGDVASLTRDGHSILGHVFGGQGTERVAAGLSQLAAVQPGAMMKLMPLVAPMIMSLLADRATVRKLDARALADELDHERSTLPARLDDLVTTLLDGIFGGTAAPRSSPYDTAAVTRGRRSASRREISPGTATPDW
ncbi:DUF937 domain-containing protein [Nonomuraea mesophila]|uniref:DUF937 domain-containing protein n=1 Tax=Nonomuraea mesophila TaxID=2530382 RepID=A0A4R5EZQ0_9ACTN|nr:DUF937 domain-containing protein [Nonomuraea mesophila]